MGRHPGSEPNYWEEHRDQRLLSNQTIETYYCLDQGIKRSTQRLFILYYTVLYCFGNLFYIFTYDNDVLGLGIF